MPAATPARKTLNQSLALSPDIADTSLISLHKKHLVESDTHRTHLLRIETLAQSEPDLDFNHVDSENLLLHSIEEVREEIRRRYCDTTREPIFVDAGHGHGPQVGWAYGYEGELSTNDDTKTAPCRDMVRVYKMEGTVVPPREWEAPSEIKEPHLEEELSASLRRLLECSELNMDDMEPETREAIAHAETVLAHVRPKQ